MDSVLSGNELYHANYWQDTQHCVRWINILQIFPASLVKAYQLLYS